MRKIRIRSIRMNKQQDKKKTTSLWGIIEKMIEIVLCKLLRLKISEKQSEKISVIK